MMAKADFITKLHAICVVCGNLAHYSYRKSVDPSQFFLGQKDSYEPGAGPVFLMKSNSA